MNITFAGSRVWFVESVSTMFFETDIYSTDTTDRS